jgi:hypothetical protein
LSTDTEAAPTSTSKTDEKAREANAGGERALHHNVPVEALLARLEGDPV